MNQERTRETDFEQRLLAELRAVVAERGAAEAAAGVAERGTGAPAWRRTGPRLALAGAGATAAVVAGILLVSSGPSAESAVATVLRDTAEIALADTHADPTPGPGQFLFTRTKLTELQEWSPEFGGGSWGVLAGMDPPLEERFRALNSWQEETWWSPGGPSRNRYFGWSPQFLYAADESDWLAAGSPPPGTFSGEPGGYDLEETTIIAQRPGLTDVEFDEGPRYRDFSNLPTEPRALRLAIEREPLYGPTVEESGTAKMPTAQVIAELWDVLNKPNTTAALRAAIFGALAEIPGIELNREAVDPVGRPGYALSFEGPGSGGYGELTRGFRIEYIFDPDTSEILGQRQIVTHPEEIVWAEEIPAGTVLRESAALGSAVVDSTRERPGESGGEPVVDGQSAPAIERTR